eukprot:scaffold112614_cov32-Attheya_sp.AAC.1
MEYDLARARNVDATPVEMYWTARTRSFLPRPVQVLRRTVAYGMVVGPRRKARAFVVPAPPPRTHG